MDRADLERLDRESLVLKAQDAGIRRARVLTRPELVDELLRLDPAIDPTHLKKTRGFFGLARDLLSKVVERGLHLPDAADRLRAVLGEPFPQVARPEPQAVPTVTLAEIYAAQGHKERALETLRRVLETEPEHGAARALLERLDATDYVAPPPPLPPEPEERADETEGAEDDAVSTPVGPRAEAAEAAPAKAAPAKAAPAKATPAPTPAPAPTKATPTKAAPAPTPAPAKAAPTKAAPAPAQGRAEDDECVAIPVSADTSYVWWRLSERSRRLASETFVFVRALVVVPTWDGPLASTRDVVVDPAAQELTLRGLPEGAIVRVAVGFIDAGTFVPFAHSPALEMAKPPARGLVQWSPEHGMSPIGPDDPRASAIVRATEGALRPGRSNEGPETARSKHGVG